MQKYWMILALVSVLMVSPCVAQTSQAHQDLGHVMRTPTQIQWQPGPASLPPGAQLAVLDGDPSQAGMAYTIGLKMPDGYRVPPHWHPMDASVIVVQGSFIMGLGEKVEPAEAQELTPGSYMRVSKEVRHYEWTKGDTIIYVYGLGPLDTIYVNPADDPRQKANQKSEKGS
jgi:quercetin dioxygenase-like cupin family protein